MRSRPSDSKTLERNELRYPSFKEVIMTEVDLHQIDAKIQLIKKTAQELKALGAEIPAIDRNMVRILASVKMLEINFSDLVQLEQID